jgi:hypothetical protein
MLISGSSYGPTVVVMAPAVAAMVLVPALLGPLVLDLMPLVLRAEVAQAAALRLPLQGPHKFRAVHSERLVMGIPVAVVVAV